MLVISWQYLYYYYYYYYYKKLRSCCDCRSYCVRRTV